LILFTVGYVVCISNQTCNFLIKIQKGHVPTMDTNLHNNTFLVTEIKVADQRDNFCYFRYFTGSDKVTRSGDIKVLHQSSDFLVVDKCYDVLINSDDPGVKVTMILA
jgi:hypothetical protein